MHSIPKNPRNYIAVATRHNLAYWNNFVVNQWGCWILGGVNSNNTVKNHVHKDTSVLHVIDNMDRVNERTKQRKRARTWIHKFTWVQVSGQLLEDVLSRRSVWPARSRGRGDWGRPRRRVFDLHCTRSGWGQGLHRFTQSIGLSFVSHLLQLQC